ncbi:malonic semialdehyde reductase [Novosphingobium sp.]|uniref:malonic semialdehyde reductase n=1 Tax=Novosphingobium sp. TaxID=1874826 RepID=UPI002636D01D|nr:malonic semialdehyde reductase [Novosphingobium sp.]
METMPFDVPPIPGRGALADETLDQLFVKARTFNSFLDKDVPDDLVRKLYDIARWGPTSANMSPGRFLFLKSCEARERIKPFMFHTNQEKVMGAPLCVIVARDPAYLDYLPQLMPTVHELIRPSFEAIPGAVPQTLTRNATLQGAYLTLAARALGLDCAPMSGFDNAAVDREFFAENGWQSDYVINIGYGDDSTIWPRNPRLEFDVACQIL